MYRTPSDTAMWTAMKQEHFRVEGAADDPMAEISSSAVLLGKHTAGIHQNPAAGAWSAPGGPAR